jgi:probable F420-dependent oxidoreductase
MELGVLIFPTDLSIRPARLARELEARGFESLWVTEHTHIPTSRKTPWPGGPSLPEEYKRTLDPFVALASAAAVTTQLRLGTGICLVAQHDPIVLAKAVASVDHVSDGRFLFGIGVGWNFEEMADHGIDPTRRRSVVREKVLAMTRLWTDEVAEFHGEFVDFPPCWTWPKPVQRPHPPIVMGGAGGPITFRHVIEYCDGWMPIHGRRDVVGALTDLRHAAEDAGRDPASIEIGVFGVPNDENIVARYRELGVARCLLAVPSAPDSVVLSLLDQQMALIDIASSRA